MSQGISLNKCCYKCHKRYEWDEEQEGYLFEDDDVYIWYCNSCYEKTNEKRVEVMDGIVNSNQSTCQWCKKSLHDNVKAFNDVTVLHLECYEKILDYANEGLNKSLLEEDEISLLERYKSHKDCYIDLSPFNELNGYFTLEEIIKLGKILNDNIRMLR